MTMTGAKPFEALTPPGKLRRLRGLAAGLTRKYGLAGSSLVFLNCSRQTNYKVISRKDQSYLLRIHWPERTDPGEVLSEFAWLRAINSETSLRVPDPFPDLDGNDVPLLALGPETGQVPCSMTRWVDGRPLIRRYGPGPDALRRVGAMLARIHVHGRTWEPPSDFRRPRWDWEGVLGSRSPFHPDAGAGILHDECSELFDEASLRARRTMASLGEDPEVFGLIHGDLIQVNYVFHEGEARAIDFGDCGFGPYLYDMAVTLFGLWGLDEKGRQRRAFLEGYREIRPLSQGHESLLNTFIAARAVALARFVMGSDDPKDRRIVSRYIPFVAEGLRRWAGA
jgi:Ser/Thr protein kinase RdoA (MazF antagonist)